MLVHAFYVAHGDSASLQREIDASANAASARAGQPRTDDSGSRVWIFPNGRRFVLPAAPTRVSGGRFGFGVLYNRS